MCEKGGANRGPKIDTWARRYGVPLGSSWCALFVSAMLDAAGNIVAPTVRTAGARTFITRDAVPIEEVLRGRVKVEPGWLIVWQLGKGWRGHIGVVNDWIRYRGHTIEGNTSPTTRGSQSNGECVAFKPRRYTPGSSLHITHFIPVRTGLRQHAARQLSNVARWFAGLGEHDTGTGTGVRRIAWAYSGVP